MTTRHRIFLSLLVVLPVSACSREVGVVRSQTGVVQGFVRVFGGGPIEPTPLPISPFSARVQVEAKGQVVATHQTPPRLKFHFSLPTGKYVVSAELDDNEYVESVGPLFCNKSPVTIRSGHTASVDVTCVGTAGDSSAASP